MRTLASLAACVATVGAGPEPSLRVHQYVQGSVCGAGLEIDVDTDYPRDGRIVLTIRAAPADVVELGLRVPAWATGATLDGEPVAPGTARLRRAFRAGERIVLALPFVPRLLRAEDRIDGIRDSAAIVAGPLVFAVEQADLPNGTAVDDLRIDASAPLRLGEPDPVLDAPVVLGSGLVREHPAQPEPYEPLGATTRSGRPVEIRAVPYFAWANRGVGAMRVWMPID
ncbi:hypothetical protein [Amnibacterium kyonggiense]